jgi:hypothetical protein
LLSCEGEQAPPEAITLIFRRDEELVEIAVGTCIASMAASTPLSSAT